MSYDKQNPYAPVKAFLPPEEPAGMTLSTLNLTVFDKGLHEWNLHLFILNGGNSILTLHQM